MNAEQTEEEVREEVLTGAAQRAFQKKRDSVKRLEEVREGGAGAFTHMCHFLCYRKLKLRPKTASCCHGRNPSIQRNRKCLNLWSERIPT